MINFFEIKLIDNLRHCTFIHEYFAILRQLKDKIIIIAVKDTPGHQFDDVMQEDLKSIGLTEDLRNKHWCGYIGIVHNSVVLFEQAGKEHEPVKSEFLAKNGIKLSTYSAPLKSGNVANIIINGYDYAVSKRGLNIVVYDATNNYVVDSVSFDTHSINCDCFRLSRYDPSELDLIEKQSVLEKKVDVIKKQLELMEYHNNHRILEIKAREKLQKGKKLKVFFISTGGISKLGLSSVYKKMEENNCFEPYIFLISMFDKTLKRDKAQEKELMNQYNLLVKSGYKTILGYDDQLNPRSLEKESPDIIFYTFPQLINLSYYKHIHINYNYLTCYVPYGMAVVKDFVYHFDNTFISTSWKIFAETYYSYYQNLEASTVKNINCILSGYPKLDDYKVCKNKGRCRKKVIIAPHWSINIEKIDAKVHNQGVFHIYYENLMTLPERYPAIDFYYKPHPELRRSIRIIQNKYGDKYITEEKYDFLLKKWDQRDNCFFVSDDEDYIPLFAQSDLMITDCGSFIGEWVPSLKPCIYMLNPNRPNASKLSDYYNELGEKILGTYYLCLSWDEIENALSEIIDKGVDFHIEERKEILNTEFINIGTSGEFIVKYLEDVLKNE